MTESYDDELRGRLSRIDPVLAGAPVDPVTSPRAHELLERTMQTLDIPTQVTTPSLGRWRGPSLIAAAAAAVVAIAVGAVLTTGSEDEPGKSPIGPKTTNALTVPGGVSMASCLPFDVAILKDMPVGLGGTVTALGSGTVTLDVDRWYKGGDADQVTISVPDGQSSVALDGVSFESDRRYLLTATEGAVNGCGFSGPASPALEKAYGQAFPG